MTIKYKPFALMGFTVLSVLIISVFFTEKAAVVSIGLGIMLFIISVVLKSVREKLFPIYIATAMVFSGIMFITVNENDLKYAESFIGNTAQIEGVLTDKPTFNNSRYYYVLDVDKINGYDVNTKVRLSLPNSLSAEPYDYVKLDAKVYKISSENHEIQLYYHSKGIFIGAFAYNDDGFDVQVIKSDKNSFGYKIYLLREEIKSRIFDKLPNENGATIIAMLLGDKTELSDELNEKFRVAGIAPIFAVSGLHLSVWVMGLYGILNEIGFKKKINSLVGIAFTIFFMFLTSLSPSVCRSGFMMILLLSANLFHRRSDSLNSLGFSAVILCTLNPFIAADTGFLMSFFATLGIVTLMPLVKKYLISKLPTSVLGKASATAINMVFVSITASIGVFPVTVFFIGYISLFSLLTNLLVTYAATICMVLGGLIAITYNVGFISDVASFFAGLLSRYLLFVVNVICDIPVTTLSTDNIFWQIGVIFCIAVLLFSLFNFKGKAVVKAVSIGMSAIIITCSISAYFYYDGLTQVRILDVDNGVSVVAFKEDSKILLAGETDGYYKSGTIIDNLNQISRTDADCFVLADCDGADDFQNLAVLQSIDFNKVIVPVSSRSLEAVYSSGEIIEASKASIETWDNGNIRYNCNEEYSLAYCDFDKTKLLILFDSEKKAEIPQEYLTADYLICSGYIPQCISPEDYSEVIVCGDDKTTSTLVEYVASRGGKAVSVDGYDSVRINIRENSKKIFIVE